MRQFDFVARVESTALHEVGLFIDSGDRSVSLYSCTTCAAIVTRERLVRHVEWHGQTS